MGCGGSLHGVLRNLRFLAIFRFSLSIFAMNLSFSILAIFCLGRRP